MGAEPWRKFLSVGAGLPPDTDPGAGPDRSVDRPRRGGVETIGYATFQRDYLVDRRSAVHRAYYAGCQEVRSLYAPGRSAVGLSRRLGDRADPVGSGALAGGDRHCGAGAAQLAILVDAL